MNQDHFIGLHRVRIGRRCYVLRPSFAALQTIEFMSGEPIATSIEVLNVQAELPRIRLIIMEGLKAHYGVLPKLPRLRPRQWQGLRADAVRFLIHGLGYVSHGGTATMDDGIATDDAATRIASSAHGLEGNPAASVSPVVSLVEPLDWRALYQSATAILGRSETEFWHMTLCGLMLQMEAHLLALGIEVARVGMPATRRDLDWLMAQFPDAPHAAP